MNECENVADLGEGWRPVAVVDRGKVAAVPDQGFHPQKSQGGCPQVCLVFSSFLLSFHNLSIGLTLLVVLHLKLSGGSIYHCVQVSTLTLPPEVTGAHCGHNFASKGTRLEFKLHHLLVVTLSLSLLVCKMGISYNS